MPYHTKANQNSMGTIHRHIKIFAFLVLMPTIAFTQENWTLEQCITYAMENNIQLKQQELNVRLEENNLTRAKLSAYPSLNASANHSYNFGRAVDLTEYTISNDLESSSFSISTGATLFSGFQITNTRKQQEINLMASISDVENLRNNLSLNIASAYLQILYSEEMVETAHRQLELTNIQIDRTRVMVEAGSLPQSNLLEIEAQQASDELQLVNAQNQKEMAYLTLIQLLDLLGVESFGIVKPDLGEDLGSLPIETAYQIYEHARETMPQIRGANLRVASSEKGLEIAKGGHYPRLNINGSYGSGARRYLETNPMLTNDPFFSQIKANASTSIGLSLSIPIFNGYQTRSSVTNAMISLDYSRLNLEYEQRILFKEIQQAYTDAFAAQKKFDATQKNLNALELAFEHSEQKFNLGLVTSFDYTTSKTRLAKAEADLISAKYEFIFKTKILDFYKGIPISL